MRRMPAKLRRIKQQMDQPNKKAPDFLDRLSIKCKDKRQTNSSLIVSLRDVFRQAED